MRTGQMMVVGVAVACVLGSTPAAGQDAAPEKLGRVVFPTSCQAEAQPEFDRAMALLHSFWFPEAIEAFEGVLERDPSCAMGHWGIALALWGNPFGGVRPPPVLAQGLAAIERARAAGARTDRERDYIAAADALYRDYETSDERARTLAYRRKMAEVQARHPDDPEAAAFYALALTFTAPPTDKTYANQQKASTILGPLFDAQPDHPGLAHYIIHANDHPPLAEQALDAARRYASIAPSVPHALHMPSHTFTRVGLWEESIETNIASANVAREADEPGSMLHAMDYQTYAYLQTAQDAAARRVVDELSGVVAWLGAEGPYGTGGYFARAAIPARYALERGQWAEAAALKPAPSPFAHVDAITYFARAIGAARKGDAEAARADIARLGELREKLLAANDAYWAQQLEIQQKAAEAWAAYAAGRREEGIALMREAVAIEDSTDKNAITPGPLAPARELLGEMLLDAGRPADALAEFQATMKKEPNRFRGVLGGARAAAAAGNAGHARQDYQELIRICAGADTPGRAELQEAREYLSEAVK